MKRVMICAILLLIVVAGCGLHLPDPYKVSLQSARNATIADLEDCLAGELDPNDICRVLQDNIDIYNLILEGAEK